MQADKNDVSRAKVYRSVNPTHHLFTSAQFKDKTLVITDKRGRWEISQQGSKLTRIQDNMSLCSATVTRGAQDINYLFSSGTLVKVRIENAAEHIKDIGAGYQTRVLIKNGDREFIFPARWETQKSIETTLREIAPDTVRFEQIELQDTHPRKEIWYYTKGHLVNESGAITSVACSFVNGDLHCLLSTGVVLIVRQISLGTAAFSVNNARAKKFKYYRDVGVAPSD